MIASAVIIGDVIMTSANIRGKSSPGGKKRNGEVTRISIVGLGYVGLATAVCFAQAGYRVYGVDIDETKCKTIQSGRSPIHEEGIDSALKESLKSGNFSCGSDVSYAVQNSDITFITVGTPSNPNGEIDLEYVKSAASNIGRAIGRKNAYHLVVVKSTVIPGTTAGPVKEILERSSGKSFPDEFGFSFNPEFLREGTAIYDTIHSDALVIGSEDERSTYTLTKLYRGFYKKYGGVPRTLIMAPANAEFVKYSVNTFRATQLSFLNSLANLCEQIPSADVAEVTKGLSTVTKIDERYLRAGLGYGGSCLPKDLRALIATFRNFRMEPTLLLSTAEVNRKQPLKALELAERLLGSLSGKKIAVLGLTFKAMTDDVRESVAISLVKALITAGAKVSVYDPQGMENASRFLQNSVNYADGALSCIKDSECCIIATEWEEFQRISASSFKKLMRVPFVIDGRRVLDPLAFEAEGVSVYEIGRYSSAHPLQIQLGPVS